MPLVRFEILPAVRLGALVYFPLLGPDQEQVFAVPVEVEAATPRQPREGSLLRIVLCGELYSTNASERAAVSG